MKYLNKTNMIDWCIPDGNNTVFVKFMVSLFIVAWLQLIIEKLF